MDKEVAQEGEDDEKEDVHSSGRQDNPFLYDNCGAANRGREEDE